MHELNQYTRKKTNKHCNAIVLRNKLIEIASLIQQISLVVEGLYKLSEISLQPHATASC